VTLVQVVPPSWVRASARLPPTVPSTQPSWDETKVTEAASKPAIGVGAGVGFGQRLDRDTGGGEQFTDPADIEIGVNQLANDFGEVRCAEGRRI